MSISEFWLHYWRQIIFFTVPLGNITFFSQNQSKEIFFEKIPSPPPEYQMDRALMGHTTKSVPCHQARSGPRGCANTGTTTSIGTMYRIWLLVAP